MAEAAQRETPLHDLEDTRRLAYAVAAEAPHGAVLVLTGPLGSGKTTFTKFLAAALGSSAAVSSPTYTLVHEYPTPDGPLVHIDAYRLNDAARLHALGFDDYRDRARLVVVEWGEALLADEPDALWLELAFDEGQPDGADHRKPDGADDPAAAAAVPGPAGSEQALDDSVQVPGRRVARWRRPPPLAASAEGGSAR